MTLLSDAKGELLFDSSTSRFLGRARDCRSGRRYRFLETPIFCPKVRQSVTHAADGELALGSPSIRFEQGGQVVAIRLIDLKAGADGELSAGSLALISWPGDKSPTKDGRQQLALGGRRNALHLADLDLWHGRQAIQS